MTEAERSSALEHIAVTKLSRLSRNLIHEFLNPIKWLSVSFVGFVAKNIRDAENAGAAYLTPKAVVTSLLIASMEGAVAHLIASVAIDKLGVEPAIGRR